MPYLSASAVVIHYEEELYQAYAPYLLIPLLKVRTKSLEMTVELT